MGYIVRYKKPPYSFLESPTKFPTGTELWFWGNSAERAHHFFSRAEAKATLRELRQGRDFKLTDFTFEKQ